VSANAATNSPPGEDEAGDRSSWIVTTGLTRRLVIGRSKDDAWVKFLEAVPKSQSLNLGEHDAGVDRATEEEVAEFRRKKVRRQPPGPEQLAFRFEDETVKGAPWCSKTQ